MSLFNKNNRKGGFMDEIRCDEPNYLMWKWHLSGSQNGENHRENAIRWGSSLRVKDGEVAVFVYKQDNGTMQDFIVGPFDQTIKTANLPVLASIIGLAYEGGTPFQAEVYFINIARLVQVKFGVPFFDVYDPRFADFGVPVAVRGTISFSIKNYREFVKLHRLNNFDLADFQAQIKDAVTRYVKDTVANAPATYNIPLVQIETKIAQITDVVEYDVSERLRENFGVEVSGVDIAAIELDKTTESYRQLLSVTRDLAGATAKAEAEANIKNIVAKQRIEEEHYEETLRIQREEGQYAQRMQTRAANMGAYQIEKQAEVGVAGAEALGQMGANGAGDIELSDGSGSGMGVNPAAMMASMAVGGAVGQSIAGAMNGMLNGIGGQAQAVPPIPVSAYHVAVNGQAAGPFDISVLTQMAATGQFAADSLVWRAGMSEWKKASEVEELKSVVSCIMPPIPSEQ